MCAAWMRSPLSISDESHLVFILSVGGIDANTNTIEVIRDEWHRLSMSGGAAVCLEPRFHRCSVSILKWLICSITSYFFAIDAIYVLQRKDKWLRFDQFKLCLNGMDEWIQSRVRLVHLVSNGEVQTTACVRLATNFHSY